MMSALCLSVGLYLIPFAARALDWQRLWLNDDQRGARQMEKHRFASAARTFDDSRWQASAWYRAGDYKRSAEAWSKMDDTDAHYNRGNALARSGDLKGAEAEYETVLQRDPDNADARHNLEVIRKLMKPSKKSGSEKQQDAGTGNSDRSGQTNKDHDDQDQRGGSQNQAADENRNRNRGEERERNREQGQDDRSTALSQEDERRNQEQRLEHQARSSSGQESGDQDRQQHGREKRAGKQTPEQQAAMEQWLRRIPDDPGGLLRRKFRYQYSQRRRGDEETDQPW
jgi:Ca-activated chloride channel family protein